MNFLRLLPVMISFLLLAAYFYRAGHMALVLVSFIVILLMMVRKTWVPSVIQLALLLGAVEWVRTLIVLAQSRMAQGIPWTRLAMILGAVALFTALSALVFRSQALRKRYSDQKRSDSR